MRLKHLEVFHAVMTTGGVTAAARQLQVTQPAVTQSIRQAEEELGFPLFVRRNNRLVPTREAHALFPEVQETMSRLESVRRAASALRVDGSRTLRIVAAPAFEGATLSSAIRAFRAAEPDVPIEVSILPSAQIATAIDTQHADLGLAVAPLASSPRIEPSLATGRLLCVGARDAWKYEATTVHVSSLAHLPLIRIHSHDHLPGLFAPGTTPDCALTVPSVQFARRLVEAGLGFAVVDSFAAESMGIHGLSARAIVPEAPVFVRPYLSAPGAGNGAAKRFLHAFASALTG